LIDVPSRLAAAAVVAALTGVLAGCGSDPPAEDDVFERRDAYPISHVLVSPREGRSIADDFARVRSALRRVEEGEAFATVAREVSDDVATRDIGGFLGFVPAYHETRFAGAVQMLRPGETRGPVHTQVGLQVLHRHPYEEGRALERKHSVVLHGFVVLSRDAVEGGSGRPPEEARAAAEEALGKVLSRQMTLAEAARVYGDQPPQRPDAYVEVLKRGPGREWIFDAVSKVAEGQVVPHVVVGPGRFGVLARGRLLRCVARQVLVLHVESEGRPLHQLVTRSRDEAARRAKAALDEAIANPSAWKAVVSKYSDAGPVVSLGGTMGVVGNGDLDANLEAALLDTPPGRVAKGVVETAAGFHVLYRVD
jgi:hypothetical protein